MTPFPEEANGVLAVATNEKIRVRVVGTDNVTEKDVGGYILVHKDDFKVLVQSLKDQK